MLYPIFSYLKYLIQSQNQHGLHSPFVYSLYTEIIKDVKEKDLYSKIETIRNRLLKDNSDIIITDFGTKGNINGLKTTKKLNSVAQRVIKAKKYSQLLYRLSNYLKPHTCIELGTSFGISTLYQKMGTPNSNFYTFEGCPNTLTIAKNNISNFDITLKESIQFIEGNFDITLPEIIEKVDTIDWAYIDGNHSFIPTISYFNQIISKTNNNSILIFDDIYWSSEMTMAWEEIKKHPKVTVSIDLFEFGIIFFRQEQAKEHFILRF